MRAREGDLIETKTGLIFDVKGLVHPPSRVIAFPRFILDPQGNREHEGRRYEKVYSISARLSFLEHNLPNYIVHDPVFDEKLCEVPLEDIKRHYRPIDRLLELRQGEKLDELELDALEFLKLLKSHANVPWSKIGVSGSLLVKLHKAGSDIDPIVYESENCCRIHEGLKILMQSRECPVRPYSMKELQELFGFRFPDTQTPFKDFVRTESRKVLQGKWKNREYFVRFVKDWGETCEEYGVIRYKNVGYSRIKATVEDDSEAIFTPCSYKLQNVSVLEGSRFPIQEIWSFRGRFCDQARNGETIIAQGKVESVTDNKENREYFRLLLGNKPSDYMILA